MGFLFLILYPAAASFASSSSSRPPPLCPHTLCQHTLCPHTLCQYTLCQHTHTHTLSTHTLSTHTLSTHTLSIHTLSTHTHTHTLTSTVVLRGRRGTHGTVWRAWSGFVARGAAALCVAGVALGDIRLRFTWQAWHKLTSTVVLRGRRGTHGTVWRAWSGFVARGAAALCVAGVALGDIHLRFTWQAWHKTHIHRRFAWQAWHSWYFVARLVRICRPGRRGILRGRRGTW